MAGDKLKAVQQTEIDQMLSTFASGDKGEGNEPEVPEDQLDDEVEGTESKEAGGTKDSGNDVSEEDGQGGESPGGVEEEGGDKGSETLSVVREGYERVIQTLERQIAALQEKGGKEVEEKTVPVEPTTWVTSEEWEQAIQDPGKMNEILQRVHDKARESLIRDIPNLTTKAVDRQISLQRTIGQFYQDNPDLLEMQQYVGYTANRLQGENPNWPLEKLLEETEKEVRKTLKLTKKAKEVENARVEESGKRRPSFAQNSRGQRRSPKPSDERTEMQKGIDQMIEATVK